MVADLPRVPAAVNAFFITKPLLGAVLGKAAITAKGKKFE